MQHAGGKILIKKLELLFPYFINESIYIYHLISLSGLRKCLVGLSDLRSSSLLFFLCVLQWQEKCWYTFLTRGKNLCKLWMYRECSTTSIISTVCNAVQGLCIICFYGRLLPWHQTSLWDKQYKHLSPCDSGESVSSKLLTNNDNYVCTCLVKCNAYFSELLLT